MKYALFVNATTVQLLWRRFTVAFDGDYNRNVQTENLRFDKNKLLLNLRKTRLMILGNRKFDKHVQIEINNENTERVCVPSS